MQPPEGDLVVVDTIGAGDLLGMVVDVSAKHPGTYRRVAPEVTHALPSP